MAEAKLPQLTFEEEQVLAFLRGDELSLKRTCGFCGSWLKHARANRKYCSDLCRNKAFRLSRRIAYARTKAQRRLD